MSFQVQRDETKGHLVRKSVHLIYSFNSITCELYVVDGEKQRKCFSGGLWHELCFVKTGLATLFKQPGYQEDTEDRDTDSRLL